MNIIFLRHGESMGNAWSKAYRDDRTNFLTLRGVKQAELASYDISEELGHIHVVYASELTRARHTAITVMQSLGDWEREYTIDSDLNEWAWSSPDTVDWRVSEPNRVFWDRVNSFYTSNIVPLWESDVNYLVVSHYYTMYAMFELIKRTNSLPNTAYQEMIKEDSTDIPNSVPFVFNSKIDDVPRIKMTGYKAR